MYRLVLMSRTWYAIKRDFQDAYNFFQDEEEVDSLTTFVEEGNPTMIVQDLEDLPEDFQYTLVEDE